MSEPDAATHTDANDETAVRTDAAAGAEAPAEAGPETGPSPEAQPARRPWWVRHYTFTGTAVGLIFIWFSMTPSLLPRSSVVPGPGQRRLRCHRLWAGRLFRLAGPLHAFEGFQPAAAAHGRGWF